MEMFFLLFAWAFAGIALKHFRGRAKDRVMATWRDLSTEHTVDKESKRVDEHEANQAMNDSGESENGEIAYEVIGGDNTHESFASTVPGDVRDEGEPVPNALFEPKDWSEVEKPRWLRKKAGSQTDRINHEGDNDA